MQVISQIISALKKTMIQTTLGLRAFGIFSTSLIGDNQRFVYQLGERQTQGVGYQLVSPALQMSA